MDECLLVFLFQNECLWKAFHVLLRSTFDKTLLHLCKVRFAKLVGFVFPIPFDYNSLKLIKINQNQS